MAIKESLLSILIDLTVAKRAGFYAIFCLYWRDKNFILNQGGNVICVRRLTETANLTYEFALI